MILRGVQKDLIVFVALEDAPPNQQHQAYGGNDSPGDQQIEYGTLSQRFFHGDLPCGTVRCVFPCLRRERLEARIGLGFHAEYRQAEWKIPVSRMETRQRRESSCGESSNVKVSEPEEGGVSD